MPFGGLGDPATARARRAPRRSTSTRSGRRSTSTTILVRSEAETAPTCHCADPGARRLQARRAQEHAAARRAPAHCLHASPRRARAASSTAVIVSTDAQEIAEIARHYGAEVPFLRPAEMAGDLSPDIEWVRYTLAALASRGGGLDCFSLLRPTSPFRQADTIRRAWSAVPGEAGTAIDSLRAVEMCRQHPGKMWVVRGRPDACRCCPTARTSSPGTAASTRRCRGSTCRTPAWRSPGRASSSETAPSPGQRSCRSSPRGYEGFDVNDPDDWWYARASGLAPARRRCRPIPQPIHAARA